MYVAHQQFYLWVLFGLGVLAGIILLALTWSRYAPVATANGWQYTVIPNKLDNLTSLVRLPSGQVAATLSPQKPAPDGTGMGRLIQVDTTTGQYKVLERGLFKPDGLLAYDGGIVVTQEYNAKPVIFWRRGHDEVKMLLDLRKPESIAQMPDGHWLVVEDSRGGRLLSVDPDTLQSTALTSGFSAAEGVCVDHNQRIFLVDRKQTSLFELAHGKLKSIVSHLRNPGFLRCTKNGIWITEDVTLTGRLLFYDYKQIHVIATHMHSPQSVLEDGDNAVLVAEQGRSRMLRFFHR